MNERRFNPQHLERLDNPERRRALPPEILLAQLPISGSDTILDLGAGTGYFTIPAAHVTSGTVYALDVQPEMLQVLQSKLEADNIANVQLVEGPIEDIPLPDNSVDHVIASFVMHEVEPLAAGIREIQRVLKANGHCWCLEWEKVQSDKGPPLHHRIHSDELAAAFTSAGFTVVSKGFPTDVHYTLLVRM